MIYTDIIQGTPEWHDIRRGKITGSKTVRIVPGVKGKYLASRKNYMAKLICEILTGETAEEFISEEMQWGTDNEPLARSAYEAITGNFVDEVGFIDHDIIQLFGSSPDGLIGEDGSIEIKCPNTATHIDTLINGKVKRDYIYQMQSLMMCGNRQWCDFISFDPRLSNNLQLSIKRFNRDEVMIAEITMEVEKFKSELSEMLRKLKEIK